MIIAKEAALNDDKKVVGFATPKTMHAVLYHVRAILRHQQIEADLSGVSHRFKFRSCSGAGNGNGKWTWKRDYWGMDSDIVTNHVGADPCVFSSRRLMMLAS